MSQERRAVVFGGAGFIGSHLLRQLLDDGWAVLVADVVPPRANGRAEFLECDVRRAIELPSKWDGATVFNLAAVHRTPGHPEHEYYETNLWGALNVTDWAARAGSEAVVFTSSIAVYGASEELKTERSSPDPNIAYGRSKLLAEHIHMRWRDGAAARRLITIRPAVVFGEGERGNFTRLAAALRARRFVYPGRKDTIKSCGYVDDLVQSMTFALETPGLDLYNYCYPDRPTIQEICEAFHDVAGFALPRAIPAAPVRWGIEARVPALAPLQARATKLITSTNIAPDALVSAGFSWKTDLVSALSDWKAKTSGQFV